jgi:hypothetical protein
MRLKINRQVFAGKLIIGRWSRNLRISWNHRVYYLFDKDPPLVHVQTIWDVSLTSCYFKINFTSFSHLQLGLQNSLFPSDFPTKILYGIIVAPLAELNQHIRAYTHADITTRPGRLSCDNLSRCIVKCLLITPLSNEICPEIKLGGGMCSVVVLRLATGWTVRGSNPGGGEIFRTRPDRPWGPPSHLYNGYRVFPGVKSGRGVKLTTHPLLVRWWIKGCAIPLLPLWTVRPVQSLSACTRVHFIFFN